MIHRWLPIAFLLLAGCAGPAVVPVASPERTWQARQALLAGLSDWSLAGRLGISDEETAWQLKLFWRQRAGRFDIDLAGPFGAGAVKLHGDGQHVVLRDGEGHRWQARDAQQLLWQHTGIRMPVDGLAWWIRGLPTPRQDRRKLVLDAAGRIAELTEDGWRIRFQEYMVVDGLELPRNLLIYRDDVEVRVVVDRWRLDGRHGGKGAS